MFVTLRSFAAALLVALVATPAFAHTGHDMAFGMVSGFLHPIGGIDHLLAMVAVGLWAAWLGGRAIWLVPGAFVVAMIGGAAIGYAGIAFSLTEIAIALSVVLLGLFVTFRLRLPLAVSMAAVALLGLAHGHAHGGEIAVGASVWQYVLGFTVATVLLHATGIAAGRIGARGALPRAAGAVTAAAGIVLLAV